MKKILFLLFFFCCERTFSMEEESFRIDSKKSLSNTQILLTKKLIIDYPVDNETIKKLKYLEGLKELILGKNFAFTSEKGRKNFFGSIKKLDNLEILNLSGKDFSASYLQLLPKNLKFLDLSGTSILPSSIKYIPGSLKEVSIKNTFLAKEILNHPKDFKTEKFILE
jgi:hypothetical protein